MNTFVLEFKMLVRNRLALSAAGMFALVMLLAAAGTWTAQARNDADKATVAAAERERWLGQGNKDPHSAAHYSIYAFKPSLPLQVLDPGIEPFVGQTVWLEAHVQNDMIYRPLQEAEPFQRAGLPDPSGLLVQFTPLLIILLAFAATAADREQGLLRMALGAARQPLQYVAGKWWAVSLAAALAVLLPAMLFGILATAFDFNANHAMRLVLWCAAALLYIGVLAALAVATCLRAQVLRTGVVLLLGAWLVLLLAGPRLVSALVDTFSPLPSFQQVKTQLENEAPAYWSAETAELQTEALREQYQVAPQQELPVDLRTALLDYNERHAQDIFDRVLGDFYNQVEAQDGLFNNWSWLSPAIALDVVSAAAAGSNFSHHHAFIEAAESYRRDLVNRMNGELLANTPTDGSAYVSDGNLWTEIPAFAHTPPGAVAILNNAGSALIALLAWLGAALLVLLSAARKLRP